MAKWTFFMSILTALLWAGTATSATVLRAIELLPNDLVITEYLANPIGVSDTQGEYFEIFNTTQSDIDLTDLVVRDDGSNAFTISGVIIPTRAFAIFSNSDGTALGLTPDYIYGGGMSLTNGDDEIGLFRPDNTLISKVSYTDGDFFGAGIAHELAALTPGTPSWLRGPSAGMDFVAAVAEMPLGNFGSPGLAGNTSIDLPAVPIPAAVWMFGSALSILSFIRLRKTGREDAGDTGDSDEKLDGPHPMGRDYTRGFNGVVPCVVPRGGLGEICGAVSS